MGPRIHPSGQCDVLSTRSLCRQALELYLRADGNDTHALMDIAASFQFNLARGIAGLAIHSARAAHIHKIALSGGLPSITLSGRPSGTS